MLIWLRSLMCRRLSLCVRSLSFAASPPFAAGRTRARGCRGRRVRGARRRAGFPGAAAPAARGAPPRAASSAGRRPLVLGLPHGRLLDQLDADLAAGDPPLAGGMPCPSPRFCAGSVRLLVAILPVEQRVVGQLHVARLFDGRRRRIVVLIVCSHCVAPFVLYDHPQKRFAFSGCVCTQALKGCQVLFEAKYITTLRAVSRNSRPRSARLREEHGRHRGPAAGSCPGFPRS